jgi:hypothetical protein
VRDKNWDCVALFFRVKGFWVLDDWFWIVFLVLDGGAVCRMVYG